MRTITVSENTFRYLKTRILLGELIPGQKLNEKELSLLLNVSSAPLREAFRLLQNENLTYTVPRRGCFVSKISIEDCRQICYVRTMIEHRAIDYLKSHDIRKIGYTAGAALLGRTFYNDIDENHSVLVKIHKELSDFHIRLVETTANEWLLRLYNSIFPTLARYQFVGRSVHVLKSGPKDHKIMEGLIARGDFDQANKVLNQHKGLFLSHIEKVMGGRNMV